MEFQDEAELCFPQFPNISCKKPKFFWSEAALLSIILSCLGLLIVTLNLLVIVTVSHFRHLHTPTNILLLSLAVSDFLSGLVMIPVEIFQMATCWFFGDLLCSLIGYMYTITSTSMGDMVLISVDRYVAICHPLRYTTTITVRRVQLCVCLCWICSISYSTLFVVDATFSSCYGECFIVIGSTTKTVDLVFTFVFPITVIVVLYVQVFAVAVSHARAMRSHSTAVNQDHSVAHIMKKSELKAFKSLSVLLFVFLMCFTPYYTVSLASESWKNTPYALCAMYLFYMNSVLNPLIYALFYPWFRKSVKLIISSDTAAQLQ